MAEQIQDPNLGQLASATKVKAEQEQFRASRNLPASGKNLAADVMRTSGSTFTGPNVQPENMSNQERAVARMNGAMIDAYKPDTHKYNKLTSFNASHHGRNFDRYYSHPKFKELGFSPWRDNEAFYNKNSSLWDDAVRGGITGTKLMGLGFASTFTNWGSLFSLKPNTEEADEMERLMSIGSSSRDGFGAKAINFGVNAGYTFGTVSEIIAEEIALAAATVFTAGAAAPGAGIRTAMNFGRLGKAAKGLYDTFKVASKIDNARQVWNASKGIKTLGKAAEYVLPFQNTMGVVRKGIKAGDTLGDMAKSSKTFGAFYRDLLEINAVTSEAKLEGGTTQNDVTNQLYTKFRADNKRDPNEQEAKGIFNQAREAGYLSSQMNAAGIYASNKIVLNRLLKGVPGMGALDNAARKNVKGTLIFDANWKKLSKEPWEAVKGIKKFGKAAYYKQTFNPKNLAKGGLGYLSANLMEGVQEVYQESIAKGISDYYVNTYNQPSRASSGEFYTKMKEGFKSQYSAQGLETFFSGFLMAGPISGAQTALFKGFDYARLSKLKMQSKSFAEDPKNAGKENPYDQQLNAEKEYTAKVVNSLNDITKEPKKYFSALEQNIKVQADLARLGEQAALDGDTMAVKNSQDESLINHMITLLDAGKFEVFQDQLKGLQELDKTDLQEAFDEDPNTTGKTVSDRISSVLERTNQIKDTYDRYMEMENVYELRQDPMGYIAFEQARQIAIRNDVTFQRQGERMAGIMNSFTTNLPFENARASDFTNLFSVGDPGSGNFLQGTGMRSEIALLTQEIENLKQGAPEQQEQAKRLEEKKNSLQSLSNLTQAFNAAYKVTQSVKLSKEEFDEAQDGFENVEILFKKAFIEHMKVLGKETGKPILDSQIEKSYKDFADYWKLNSDRDGTAAAINMLNSPEMYKEATLRIKSAMEDAMQRREENLKNALAEYKLKFMKNAFFNDLFEQFNAFVDPDEALAYIDDQIVPTTFIDADTLEVIKPTDSKYTGIMGLVDKYDEVYFDETGKRLSRPIVGSKSDRVAGIDAETGEVVDQAYTTRNADDKRTLKDLGTEFGFAHLQNLSEVDAVAVLTAIMKSSNKFVPASQKKLAQALLNLIKPGTKITFKNNHFTNSTYDPTNGIIVDARYSSEGFTNGNIPMEFSILNAVMQQVVSESLTTDTEFNDRITALREQTKEALSENELQLPYFAYALSSNQKFVAEVMTNPEFKSIMATVPLTEELTEQTEEAKSLWKSFIDSVYDLFKKLFGIERGKTLYQEAVNVITNKLSQPGAGTTTTTTTTETVEEFPPVEAVTDPELEALLKTKYNEIVEELTPEERMGMSYDSWKQSDSTALGIVRKYKADKIKKAAADVDTEEQGIMTLAEKKKRFTALGYTLAEMNTMSEDVVNDILKNNTKKTLVIDVIENGKKVSKEIPFDAYVKFGDHIERSVSDALRILAAKNMELNPEETEYVQYDALGVPIPGTEHARVSTVVKDKFDGSDEAAQRGNIIDGLLREFVLNQIGDINQFIERYNYYKAKNPKAGAFGPIMLEQLYDKMRTINLVIKQKGLKIRSDVGTLSGKIGSTKTAGKIDLLAYDGKGKIYIIDLKTSSQDRRLQYKLEETLEKEFGADYKTVKENIKGHNKNINLAIDSLSGDLKKKLKEISERPEFAGAIKDKGMMLYFYKEADGLQQNAYRELLRQETGLEADAITIFPLLTTKKGNVYTSVNFQKEGGNHTLSVPIFDIHKRLGLDNEIVAYPENQLSPENLTEFTEEQPPVPPTPEETPATGKVPFNGIETTEFAIPGVSMEGFTIDGNYYNVLSHYGRAKTLVNINGVVVPFYLTSGSGGKGLIPGWYPFGGIGQDGWLNKTGKDDMETYYSRLIGQENADLLKAVAAKLNEQYGTDPEVFKDPDADPTTTDKPITSLADKTEDYINSKLPFKPTSNLNPFTLMNFESNMTQLGEAITKARAEAPTPEPVGTDVIEAIETRRIDALKEYYKQDFTGKTKSIEELTKELEELNAKYNAELVAEYRKQEIAEFRNDVENAESFIVNGRIDSKKVKASSNAKAKEIYDRYDGLITPLLEGASVSSVERNPVIGDTLTSDSNSNYKIRGFASRGGIQWENTKDGSQGVWNKETFDRYVKEGRLKYDTAAPASDKKAEKPVINIYWGSPESSTNTKVLSNLAPRKFTYQGKEYGSVEHAYQTLKSGSFDQDTFDKYVKAGGYGTKIRGKAVQKGFDNLQLMRNLVVESFKQNPDQAKLLLNYSDFTHTTNEVIDKAFLDGVRLAQKNAELAALEGKPAETGTQTQLDFEELTLNVGDRVKVNTKTDGEGIIKEDRGDKVLLQDGRQVMKKNLTKLGAEAPAEESKVTDKFKGKVIYTTPSNESTTALTSIPGVIYGNTLYARVVLGDADNGIVEKLRAIAERPKEKKAVVNAANTLISAIQNGAGSGQVKDINYAMTVLENPTTSNDKELSKFITAAKKNAWQKTMTLARGLANSGKTVVFDNMDAAKSSEIDLAFIDANSSLVSTMTDKGKANLEAAQNQISKDKMTYITGKGLVNTLTGAVSDEYVISSNMMDFKASIDNATKGTLAAMDIELRMLTEMGALESILAQQGLTVDQARDLYKKKKADLSNRVDIKDLVVDANNPTVISYIESNGIMGTGVVVENDGSKVSIAPYVPNQTFGDLQESKERITFTASAVPYAIVSLATKAAVSVDISVKNQSDTIMKNSEDNKASELELLQKAMKDNENESASDVINKFIASINCNKGKV